MGALTEIDIKQLSQSERIILVEKLWDSIAKEQDSIEVTDAQKSILEERLADYKLSPLEGSTWDEVKTEMK